jgi:hypothetical protein
MVMTKPNLLGALAAGALAIATVATASPAAADARFSVYIGPTYSAPPPRHKCWHWSYRVGAWVNSCRTYSYRYRAVPVYPDNGPYAYGYGPSYSYGPSFGFSFSTGGNRHHHRHMN